jgi:hypothetical protein
MRFHETLSSVKLQMYFAEFQFCFQKKTAKFRFHLIRFEISKFPTWQWQKLKKSIMQLLNGWLQLIEIIVPGNKKITTLFKRMLFQIKANALVYYSKVEIIQNKVF